MSDLIFKGTVDEIDVGKLHVGTARADQGRRASDRRRHRKGLAHRAAGAAEGRRDALRRRDRARADDEHHAARRLLRQRRPHHPRRQGRPDDPRARRDLRGRRQEDLRRAARARTPKEPPKKIAVKLGVSDGLNVEVVDGLANGREGRRAAAEEAHLRRRLTRAPRPMLSFRDALRQMWRDIRSQKLRTFLTIFGIVWGTVSVTLLLAFGKGLQRQMIVNAAGHRRRHLHRLARADLDPVRGPRQGTQDPRQRGGRRGDPPRRRAACDAISSEYSKTLKLNYGTKTVAVDISGVSPEFGGMRNLNPAAPAAASSTRPTWTSSGASSSSATSSPRQSSARPTRSERPCMLGGSPFLVVGVLEEKIQHSSYSGRDNDKGFIPGTTYRALTGEKWVNNLIYQPTVACTRAEPVTDDVRRVLARPAALRSRRQGSLLGLGHDRGVRVLRHVLPVVPALPRDHRLVHADRRRHRRLEHHERRRRGAHEGDRHQDGARRARRRGSCGSSCSRPCSSRRWAARSASPIAARRLRGLSEVRRHRVRRRSRTSRSARRAR